jgi:hypothetical protein
MRVSGVSPEAMEGLGRLREILAVCGRVVVGYSGGIDSTFLLWAALGRLGRDRVLGVTGVSPSLADAQLEEAARQAREMGAPHRLIRTAEAEDPEYLANAPDRCYHCKSELYARLLDLAPARVLGTCTFYTMLKRGPVGRLVVSVCTNVSCLVNGGPELLEQLRAVEPAEVPLNFLNPRPGTPLQIRKPVQPLEAIRWIALFRLALPTVILRYAGGREVTLREPQAMGLTAGINALIVGNYLTTLGRSPEEDLQMLADLKMPIGVLSKAI